MDGVNFVDKISFPGQSVSLFTFYYLQYVISFHGSFLTINRSVLFTFNNLIMKSMSKQASKIFAYILTFLINRKIVDRDSHQGPFKGLTAMLTAAAECLFWDSLQSLPSEAGTGTLLSYWNVTRISARDIIY